MKNTIIFFCCILVSIFAVAQQQGFPTRPGGSQNMNTGHLYGKIVDAKTNKGIEGVTVQLIGGNFGTQQRKQDSTSLKTDSTHKFDSGYHNFDTSHKFDSGFHRFDSSHKSDSAFHRFDTFNRRSDTTKPFNKPTQKSKDQILATVLTQANGDFSLE